MGFIKYLKEDLDKVKGIEDAKVVNRNSLYEVYFKVAGADYVFVAQDMTNEGNWQLHFHNQEAAFDVVMAEDESKIIKAYTAVVKDWVENTSPKDFYIRGSENVIIINEIAAAVMKAVKKNYNILDETAETKDAEGNVNPGWPIGKIIFSQQELIETGEYEEMQLDPDQQKVKPFEDVEEVKAPDFKITDKLDVVKESAYGEYLSGKIASPKDITQPSFSVNGFKAGLTSKVSQPTSEFVPVDPSLNSFSSNGSLQTPSSPADIKEPYAPKSSFGTAEKKQPDPANIKSPYDNTTGGGSAAANISAPSDVKGPYDKTGAVGSDSSSTQASPADIKSPYTSSNSFVSALASKISNPSDVKGPYDKSGSSSSKNAATTSSPADIQPKKFPIKGGNANLNIPPQPKQELVNPNAVKGAKSYIDNKVKDI